MKSFTTFLKVWSCTAIAMGSLFTICQVAEALVGGRWVRMPADGLVSGKSGGKGPLAV